VGALWLWTLPSSLAVEVAVIVGCFVLTAWTAQHEPVRRIAIGALLAQSLALVWVTAIVVARA
jgi:hypothetical protein